MCSWVENGAAAGWRGDYEAALRGPRPHQLAASRVAGPLVHSCHNAPCRLTRRSAAGDPTQRGWGRVAAPPPLIAPAQQQGAMQRTAHAIDR